jgi:preprotein translocase subunit SecA
MAGDVQYVVRDGKVVIVDETTGRMLPDSVWSNGLHAMACVKEGLEPPPHTRTCGQITLQTLLGRYCKLGGISGTLRDARLQLRLLYGLTVRRVVPRLPNLGRHLGLRLTVRRRQQYDAVVDVIRRMRGAGRGVLVGTDSVAAAEALSTHLSELGIAHELLTARDDEREADVVSRAGAPGAVTVSTNVAGRGTHIDLHPGVVAAGGLHVMCCTQNGSPRIDRQLFGRAARNGQPGSYEVILCLEDPQFANYLPRTAIQVAARMSDKNGMVPRPASRMLAWWVQSLSVWNQFFRSWQSLQHARRSREALLRLPNME